MLITLCYSVLTWMQSRQRSEITGWLEEYLSKSDSSSSLVFIRGEAAPVSTTSSGPFGGQGQGHDKGQGECFEGHAYLEERPSSASSFYYSANNPTDSLYSSAWSAESSRCSSAFSTPRHQPTTPDTPKGSLSVLLKQSPSFDSAANSALMSPLCYNHGAVLLRRLLWQEEGIRALAVSPRQIVELHDWTAFKQGHTYTLKPDLGQGHKLFRILLEAEPGTVKRHQYRKFSSFGLVVAWRWGLPDLGLILECDALQMTQLMHIFRLGNIVLDGGWRVYRLTTIATEGSVGTLISRPTYDLSDKNLTLNLTPAELRRLSASNSSSSSLTSSSHLVYRPLATPTLPIPPSGIFERVSNLSNHTSKHDITTIAESEEDSSSSSGHAGSKQLLNWYERSPRKRSVANLPTFEKASTTPRRRSFCPGILSSGAKVKSASLVSLLFKQSISVDEESEEEFVTVTPTSTATLNLTSTSTPSRPLVLVPSSKSHDSLSSLATTRGGIGTGTPNLLSPVYAGGVGVAPLGSFRSMTTSPRRGGGMGVLGGRRSPQKRTGKPPNILVLCDDAKKREEIGTILKNMLANDRYAVYDIRWDQLEVGGWSEQTAVLVLAGVIPQDDPDQGQGQGHPESLTSLLLQFLGDGGRLLTWACEGGPPFGPGDNGPASTSSDNKRVLEYSIPGPGASQKKVTRPLTLAPRLWTNSGSKIVETTDSEGYSRPLTSSVWARVKEPDGMGVGPAAVLQLDGGALGGKAILSQIEFEKCCDEEGSLGLLSQMLGQLGIDCSPIKSPEYSIGYLLGDHKKVQDFLSSIPPPTLASQPPQSELTLEFTPRGEKGSLPSHALFPIHSLECPTNFSTLEYYDNLETKDLGRLVIYTDTITSTTHVLAGRRLRHGLVVIAGRQTGGRGRGRNIWLSPFGCATFSLQLVVRMDSALGRRLSLIQHVAALSVILAVPNHKEHNIRVKWPNDIYAGEQKIGGVLVESRLEGGEAVINIGIGVNVSNPYPTLCLNSVLFPDFKPPEPEPSTTSKGSGPPLPKVKDKSGHWTTEKLISRTLNQMEGLIQGLEGQEGLEAFLQLYQDNWIHHSSSGLNEVTEDDQESLVNVEISEGIFTECRISGIDEYGFLRVIDSRTGNVFSVRPDGNSFDIANRLIAIKD